jgi:hypothetical protein
MAQFLGIHEGEMFIDNSKASEGDDPWEGYKAACAAKGLKALHVHYNMDDKRAFCLTEANSAEEVLAAHEDANLTIKEVIEVETAE